MQRSLIWTVIWAAIVVFPFWKINAKAGYPGWLSLLMVIPLVNLAYLYFLAFSSWPNLGESEHQQDMLNSPSSR